MSRRRPGNIREQRLSESDDDEPNQGGFGGSADKNNEIYKIPLKKRGKYSNIFTKSGDEDLAGSANNFASVSSNDFSSLSGSINDLSSVSDNAVRGVKRKVEGNESLTTSKNAAFGNDAVSKMMNKMGYQPGKGLGAKQQGRAEPVSQEMRLGRAGLGAKKTGLEPDFGIEWDSSQEDVIVQETVVWMPECHLTAPNKDDMEDWIKVGQRVTEIDNETEFCTPDALRDMLDAKSVFDELNDRDLRNARTRANPFESIKGAFFQNRAAMKTANLDAVFDFVLTDPKNEQGEPLVPKNGPDLFYFADVCAGPGGFTEYLLWKRNEYSAHGFGFTLRGKDDFKLDNFLASSSEYFEPYYGISGNEGDGDVMNAVNLENFRELVMKVTFNKGIHLFMADGGFSVDGQENIQEILSKRLYLCQILCAFNILAVGGNLICKLFDVFTPFSAGLLYLMWRCFDKVCLHKPHTSRPANSERYVVALGFRCECDDVIDFLKKVNAEYEKIKIDKSLDILEMVPLSILRESPKFCEYLTESNDRMAKRQTMYLRKYKAFARNRNLQDNRQHDLRARCMEYWGIPDEPRPQQPRVAPNNRFAELCDEALPSGQNGQQWFTQPGTSIDETAIDETNFLEYRFSVASTNQISLVLAMGRQTFLYDGHDHRWNFVDRTFFLNIPKDTIILGEFCFEFKDGQGKNQQRQPVLRIFDAFMLNGKNVSELPYRDRLNQIKKFCLASSREFSRPDMTVARPVEAFKLHDLKTISKRIEKGNVNRCERLVFKNVDGSSHFEFKKLLFLRIVRDPWRIFCTKSQGKPYFFNSITKESLYDGKPESLADFKQMFSTRRLWTLPSINEAEKAKAIFENFVNVIIGKEPKRQ